ncbi:MAG: endonuclease [Paludibacteraceae bacterium]|nr:endonuclease [Paludibacteraceae bacterium]
MKRFFTFILSVVLLTSVTMYAAIPSGYYTAANNKKSTALLSALHGCIDGHTTLSYSSLKNYYDDTDLTADGYIWDMYSTCKFTINDDGSSQSRICDVWNKEHSVPQSWFGESSPMKSDLFHVYPTDARVNNFRGNLPYGETSSRSYIDNNSKALGYIGSSNFSGYSGKVFEPVDQYKGDFARTYFYMVARYLDKSFNKSENGKVVFTYSNSTTGLTTYAVNLFLKWHRQDPVSQKEIDRNNAVYKHQKNRNPFIDYPYLAEYIWGEKKNETMILDELMSSSDPDFIPGESDGSREDVVRTPVLNVSVTTVNFPSVLVDEESSYSIKVTGMNLTADVTLTISGEDADMFESSRSSLSIAEANNSITQNNLILTYVPTEEGQHSGILKIASEGAETITVKLYGACNAACQVTWKVNGEEYTVGNPTTSLAAGSKVTKLPTAPKSPCTESNQFVGWSEEVITTPQDDMPIDLFSDVKDAPAVSHDVVYNAVFAHLSETDSSAPETLIFAKDQETGWTISGTSYTNKYWILKKNAYIESPVVNLSKLQSMTLNVRTYGGTSYNIIDITCNGQVLTTIDAENSTLKDKTWKPTTALSGEGKIRFSSTDNTDANGPAIAKVTINLEGGTSYVYTNYITYCGPTTDLQEVQPLKPQGNKLLRDGQLVIEHNGVYYNTLGQKVQ